MSTVYTTSLYSVEITRRRMNDIILACKDNGVLDRVKFNDKLQSELLLYDSDPDMNKREFESAADASNATNHRAEADYYTSAVSYFRLSGRVIESWERDGEDDEEPTFKDIVEIDSFDDETIDKILERFPYGNMR